MNNLVITVNTHAVRQQQGGSFKTHSLVWVLLVWTIPNQMWIEHLH